MVRSNEQIKQDVAFLSRWLSEKYDLGVRDKIIALIDKRLGLGGRLVDGVAKFLAGQAIAFVLKDLNITVSVMNFTLGIWQFCFKEASLEQDPRNMTPYSPRDNSNEYVAILIAGWKRGDFRYLPIGMIYTH